MTEIRPHANSSELDGPVAIVGLGYVGLPLALAIAETGRKVIGVDVDADRVDRLQRGQSYIEDVSGEKLLTMLGDGSFTVTHSFDRVAEADAVIIAVPTPIDVFQVPQLEFIRSASSAVAQNIRSGALVVLESTTYPGCTEEILAGALRAAGKEPGRDVLVAYSPERIDPGNRTWTIRSTPKLVAGWDAPSLAAAQRLYGSFIDHPIPVSNIRSAELAKLFENIFRVVNIALVNELQVIADTMGLDVWEVIEACATKPYGFMPFYPGPGLGGHCVPVDPLYLAWKAREFHVSTEFIELAARINASMPGYVATRLSQLLSRAGKAVRGAKVLVLGVAYKRDTSDTRESPAIRVIELLLEHEADLAYHDPHVPSIAVNGRRFSSTALDGAALDRADAVVILTDHSDVDWDLIADSTVPVLDTRNILRRRTTPALVPSD